MGYQAAMLTVLVKGASKRSEMGLGAQVPNLLGFTKLHLGLTITFPIF